jgi:hypothetical protein
VPGGSRRRPRFLVVAACLGLLAAPPAGALAAKPELGRTAVVQRVKGTVLVRERGERRYQRLAGVRVIPLRSTVDATRGQVRVTTAASRSGRTQSGVFSQGAFTITQTRGRAPVTELRLAGRLRCPARGRPLAGPAQRRVRRLRGNARGRFRTRGRHSSATIRGTVWTTADRCDGTQTTSEQGEVVISDGEQSFRLPEGFAALFYCEPVGAQPLDRRFCISTLGNGDLWGFGISARTDLTDYQVCVVNPAADVTCRNFQFDSSSQDARGGEVKYGDVFCLAGDGPGRYFVAWGFNNEAIGVALPFVVTEPTREGICPFDQEEVGLPEAGATRMLRREPSSLPGPRRAPSPPRG